MSKKEEKLIQRVALSGLSYHNYGLFAKQIQAGDELSLTHDKSNQFDKFAVRVSYIDEDGDAWQIGWIPKGQNETIARLLEAGTELTACVIAHEPARPLQERIFVGIYISLIEA